jgi:hypothetical protein
VNMPALAGWLFADLLLVLFITVFASTTLPSAPPHPARASTRRPAPGASHPPRQQQVLILRPHKFILSVPYPGIKNGNGSSAADKAVAAELEHDLKMKNLAHARAGLVEVFGWSPLASGDGTKVAAMTNLAIIDNLSLFADAYTQSFWNAGSDGTVTVRVFFFARQ